MVQDLKQTRSIEVSSGAGPSIIHGRPQLRRLKAFLEARSFLFFSRGPLFDKETHSSPPKKYKQS